MLVGQKAAVSNVSLSSEQNRETWQYKRRVFLNKKADSKLQTASRTSATQVTSNPPNHQQN